MKYPQEALLFRCTERAFFDEGTLVEMVGIGAPVPDDDEGDNRPAIRAQMADREEVEGWHNGWYYFYDQDIEPLTLAACDAFAEYLAMHGQWKAKFLLRATRKDGDA